MEVVGFMNHNVAGRAIKEARKLLVYGTCLARERPELVAEYARGRAALAVCLEETHVNMFVAKLAGVLARVPLDELVVLTVDGSLHCVQLHMGVEEALKVAGASVHVKHLVVEGGRVVPISPKAVKTARYLSKIEKLLGSRGASSGH